MRLNTFGRYLLFSTLSALALVAGCSMQVGDKDKEGSRKVAIQTPLGDMKVDTKEVDAKDTGLPVYPGARPSKEDFDGNKNKANVNMNTPWFGLKVVALSYETDDPQEKVWEFYKKEMSKYGKVLECKPGSPDENTRSHGDDVLGCQDQGDKGPKHVEVNPDEVSLKVGVPGRLRVVGFRPVSKGTRFSLVYIVTRDSRDTI